MTRSKYQITHNTFFSELVNSLIGNRKRLKVKYRVNDKYVPYNVALNHAIRNYDVYRDTYYEDGYKTITHLDGDFDATLYELYKDGLEIGYESLTSYVIYNYDVNGRRISCCEMTEECDFSHHTTHFEVYEYFDEPKSLIERMAKVIDTKNFKVGEFLIIQEEEL